MTAHALEQAAGAWTLATLAFCTLWSLTAAALKRRRFTRHCNTANVIDIRRGRGRG